MDKLRLVVCWKNVYCDIWLSARDVDSYLLLQLGLADVIDWTSIVGQRGMQNDDCLLINVVV